MVYNVINTGYLRAHKKGNKPTPEIILRKNEISSLLLSLNSYVILNKLINPSVQYFICKMVSPLLGYYKEQISYTCDVCVCVCVCV